MAILVHRVLRLRRSRGFALLLCRIMVLLVVLLLLLLLGVIVCLPMQLPNQLRRPLPQRLPRLVKRLLVPDVEPELRRRVLLQEPPRGPHGAYFVDYEATEPPLLRLRTCDVRDLVLLDEAAEVLVA
eukprot:CAMPEP_0183304130 /NCGR_PEP_ID=MMETSP0160_2-20130417/9332_1 /TAXON_ID=2839 ORGANISM="Odontella Sinensis, Strain Grunow 1884" /NCGR_SAMPLE_ID=MMETSP0160_2 /ASSEMBLY_ACC=CAM_ASM_000250 /LENGTH=126 /DNA_ID=CAMNT_0025467131 /DNA_START=100 /DNA_END=480 /DNA_ORIENTATION=-